MEILRSEIEIKEKWIEVTDTLKDRFDKIPDLNAILFIIGLREKKLIKKNYTKEEKQDLINLAVCKILSFSGYFNKEGNTEDGWPVWTQSKPMPRLEVNEQELLLKDHIIIYFESEKLI